MPQGRPFANADSRRMRGLLNEAIRMPLVVRRTLRWWRGETIMFGLWCFKPLEFVPLLNLPYRMALANMVYRSGLFDENYYWEANSDVKRSSYNALIHYVRWGDKEGRRPTPVFDPVYYRSHAKGFTCSVNSLLHYKWVGCHRDYPPSPWFDNAHYIRQNRDVALSGINPLLHYLRWGGQEGRSPSSEFDTRYYQQTYPDVAESGANPLVHYVLWGREEGRLARGEPVVSGSDREPVNDEQPDQIVERIIECALTQRCRPVVDVIIPVYLNRVLTLRCIQSVLIAHNNTPHQVIVLNDASPDVDLCRDLEILRDNGLITLVTSRENLGFVITVNRGMRLHPDRDVVLLNSDTEVYPGWLDRLHKAAHAASDIGSVTPLSNNATICSYPRFLHDNPYPLEVGYAELDRLCAQANAGVTAEAPTGVGFCMYLRREAITAVGRFDEAAFGKGYGEENDWCQRAIMKGWKNLITADTFVRHFGNASFQGEKEQLVAAAMRTLAKRHPGYHKKVQSFIHDDPLKAARERLDWQRLREQSKKENILFVCHGRGGGAERHLQEDAETQRKKGRGIFFLRPVVGVPALVQIEHPACRQLPNISPWCLADTGQCAAALQELRITCIHSHGLVDFEPEAARYLQRIAAALGVPLHVDIHDYKVICPRINLAKSNGRYCGEPGSDKACNKCLKTEGNDFGIYDIRAWREMHHRVLKAAERIYVPDIDVAERLQRYYPDVTFTVLPHENIEYQPNPRPLLPGERLRVVVIGAISKIKGYDVLLECARDARKKQLPVDYILMGYSMDDDTLKKAGVKITGKYREDEALQKLDELEPHVAFFPALWPETYSYTLTIALRAGLPVVVFDIGAIASRLREIDWEQGLMPLKWVGHPRKVNKLFLSYSECTDPIENVKHFSCCTSKSAVHSPREYW